MIWVDRLALSWLAVLAVVAYLMTSIFITPTPALNESFAADFVPMAVYFAGIPWLLLRLIVGLWR